MRLCIPEFKHLLMCYKIAFFYLSLNCDQYLGVYNNNNNTINNNTMERIMFPLKTLPVFAALARGIH